MLGEGYYETQINSAQNHSHIAILHALLYRHDDLACKTDKKCKIHSDMQLILNPQFSIFLAHEYGQSRCHQNVSGCFYLHFHIRIPNRQASLGQTAVYRN